jgi:integration host factor subunit beta
MSLGLLDFGVPPGYTRRAFEESMTKADLISIVADRLKITQVQSSIIVEAALRSVVNALRNGEEVEIRGFGSFRFRNRAPRKGRNPKTGEKVDVPPKKIPYFKMGKELKALLNGSMPEDAETTPAPTPTGSPES